MVEYSRTAVIAHISQATKGYQEGWGRPGGCISGFSRAGRGGSGGQRSTRWIGLSSLAEHAGMTFNIAHLCTLLAVLTTRNEMGEPALPNIYPIHHPKDSSVVLLPLMPAPFTLTLQRKLLPLPLPLPQRDQSTQLLSPTSATPHPIKVSSSSSDRMPR